MAKANYLLGRYGEVEAQMQRVLPIYERKYGADHPMTAGALAQLGNAVGALGRRDEKLATKKVCGGESPFSPPGPRAQLGDGNVGSSDAGVARGSGKLPQIAG
jgi:hypothetical protein